MLLSLIKNEFIKIFKRGKTWIVFGLFIAFIGVTAYGTWSVDKDARYYSSPEYQISSSKESLEYLEESLKTAKEENNADWILSLEDSIRYYKQNIEEQEEILKNGLDVDAWKEDLSANINGINEMISELEKDGITDINKDQYSSLKLEVEKLEHLLENNLEPLNGWEYSVITFMSNASLFLGIGLLVAGIAIFMSDMVSGESTPPTLKFLLIQPVSRGKILFSKYLVSIITVLLLILTPQVIGLGIINSTSEVNVENRLITVGQEFEKVFDIEINEMTLKQIPDTAENITFKEFQWRSLGYQSLFVISATTVIFMFSTIFKSSMISMATSVILTIFMSIGAQLIGPVKKIAHLMFTTYADSNNILTSGTIYQTNNTNITITNGLICMAVTLIVTYVISYINFTKKDMLI